MAQYHERQLQKVEETHDFRYNLSIKIFGTGDNTNQMDISKEQFKQIKQILIKGD